MLLAVFGLLSDSGLAQDRVQIFRTSQGSLYEKTTLSPEMEGAWMGIYCQKKRCEARPAVMRIVDAPGQIINPNSSDRDGKRVILDAAETPTFLIRGLPLRRGPIESIWPPRRAQGPDPGIELSWGGKAYMIQIALKTEGYSKNEKGELVSRESISIDHGVNFCQASTCHKIYQSDKQQDYRAGKKSQIEAGIRREALGHLLWAGDLDGDGKLDLLFNFHWRAKEGGTTMKLFLSSVASQGQFLGEAAQFSYWDPNNPGC